MHCGLEIIRRIRTLVHMTDGDSGIQGVRVEAARVFADERGWLSEVFRADEGPEDEVPVMSYLSVTNPGVARGPHEHVDQTDRFGFFGPGDFELRLWDNRPGSPTHGRALRLEVGAANPTLVVVPPGVVHGYRNISDIPAWVINFPNRLFMGAGRREPIDEIRHEEDPEAPFSMDGPLP